MEDVKEQVPKSMKVLMYYSNRDVRVEEMPVPSIGPGEILMKVISSGICGSDVMEWYRRDKVPLVLGHEVAGIVVETGKGVDRFSPGDRIASTHHVPCFNCHYCHMGHHTVCDTLLRGTHFEPGGFAQYLRIPAINVERGTFRIPESVTFEHASFMEPLACVLRGQRNAPLMPGGTVLVLGCGISGLLHIRVARFMGAGLIVAYDSIDYRLALAREMGADICVKAGEPLMDILKEKNQGRLADFVVLCYEGFSELGVSSIERGGVMLFFSGASEGAALTIPINQVLWRREITVKSTYAGAPYDCYQALSLIREGILPVEKLITHRLPLEEGQKGFSMVSSPVEHECVKVIIEPNK